MNTFNSRLLYRVTLSAGTTMDLSQALDLIAFRELDVVVYVHEAATGEAPTFIVEHASNNEEGDYLAFTTPMEVDLTVTGTTWVHATTFTRWIAWRSGGAIETDAVVSMDIVARS